MIRWIQHAILAGLLCGFAFGQASNATPDSGQVPDTQAAPNSQQGPSTSPGQVSPPAQVQGQPGNSAEPQQPTPAPTQTEPKKVEEKSPEKSSPTHSTTRKKHTAKKNSSPNTGKVVVHNGGARDTSPQLSPGMTSEQALHSRENTSQLLATTDANVNAAAGRQLSPAQQSMVNQIHTYVRQSKAASASGDLTRAHTLAYKAHLLSDELAGK